MRSVDDEDHHHCDEANNNRQAALIRGSQTQLWRCSHVSLSYELPGLRHEPGTPPLGAPPPGIQATRARHILADDLFFFILGPQLDPNSTCRMTRRRGRKAEAHSHQSDVPPSRTRLGHQSTQHGQIQILDLLLAPPRPALIWSSHPAPNHARLDTPQTIHHDGTAALATVSQAAAPSKPARHGAGHGGPG